MRYAAGDDRVTTCDGQRLAERMLGDSIGANLVMMGFAFQHGLVPVSVEALERAIELNGVAIQMNKSAFGLGRARGGRSGGARPGSSARRRRTRQDPTRRRRRSTR